MSCAKEDRDTIAAWFARWGDCVARVDYDAARPLFSPDVLGFGTWKDTVAGLDPLIEAQWRNVWPTIRDFRFELDSLRCLVAADRLSATALLTWSSTGIGEDGRPFDRPGRATVALRRAELGAPWRGEHTHFSLYPGTPKRSYGDRTDL